MFPALRRLDTLGEEGEERLLRPGMQAPPLTSDGRLDLINRPDFLDTPPPPLPEASFSSRGNAGRPLIRPLFRHGLGHFPSTAGEVGGGELEPRQFRHEAAGEAEGSRA